MTSGNLESLIVANNQITITHVATGFEVSFPAYLDTFSDAYRSNWSETEVFGRMDTIPTYQNTERALALAWSVPASSFEEAQANLGKINQMISFLYPLYDQGHGGATLINQSPLVRIKFGNLVRNLNGDGLLGWLHGLTFDPEMGNGVFTQTTPHGERYYPKSYRINCELTVLHENEFGYSIEEWSRTSTLQTNDGPINASRTYLKYTNSDNKVNYNTFPYGSSGGDAAKKLFKVEYYTEQSPATTKTKGAPNTPSRVIPENAIDVRRTISAGRSSTTWTVRDAQRVPKWTKGANRRNKF